MKQDDIRTLKRQLQYLESLLDDISNDAEVLNDEGVDTASSTTLLNKQEETQDELEQSISDLLAVLALSDRVEDGQQLSLPDTARRPVASAQLPEPSEELRNRLDTAPVWSQGGN